MLEQAVEPRYTFVSSMSRQLVWLLDDCFPQLSCFITDIFWLRSMRQIRQMFLVKGHMVYHVSLVALYRQRLATVT